MIIIPENDEDFPLPDACLHCEGELKFHDCRKRCCIFRGEKTFHTIRRYRCRECRKTITVLKKFMLPYKHHAAPEIEEALRDESACETHADARTIGRWRNGFSALLPSLLGRMEEIAEGLLGACPAGRGLLQQREHAEKVSLKERMSEHLQRHLNELRRIVEILLKPSPGDSPLAIAMFIGIRHRLCRA